ncbi:DUF2493 domain-containing protein [Virgibacillus salexigens]|uniref:YspA cpYpsA-related SLOG domain-containing protein n=1 Tax=Virgibacillus massiliensis TaxID=1462526 RepID=A0A024QI35_9BACI|nr:DUF2493 domain-containing protein [Virgibacillus massiliensis]CDQ41855.1 hypothetical protein BN990_04234 [Virgibacillus massiliensis]
MTFNIGNDFRVIIAGGRDFNNYDVLYQCAKWALLNYIHSDIPITIVSGTARGADSLGESFAKDNSFSILPIPADWKRYGKKAGYLRNAEMAKHANALIAFWDGHSRGTRHMIDLAYKHNLEVLIFDYQGNLNRGD